MRQLIPNQFLFRFAFSCRYHAALPGSGTHLVDLPAGHTLPFLGAMDSERERFELAVGWNESGLGIQWQTTAKRESIYGEPDRPSASDGLSLWLDTRDTRTIHRASRYCHFFYLLTHNGEQPAVPQPVQKPLHRALEDAPVADLSAIRLALFGLTADGALYVPAPGKPPTNYRMEVFLPASCLHGFDPETSSRLGIFYRIRDRELGDQLLSAGTELPYWEDPSLWSVLELVRDHGEEA